VNFYLEHGEDPSLLEFKAIQYERRGNATAIAEQLQRIEEVPKREFVRRGDQPGYARENMPEGASASVQVGKGINDSSTVGVRKLRIVVSAISWQLSAPDFGRPSIGANIFLIDGEFWWNIVHAHLKAGYSCN